MSNTSTAKKGCNTFEMVLINSFNDTIGVTGGLPGLLFPCTNLVAIGDTSRYKISVLSTTKQNSIFVQPQEQLGHFDIFAEIVVGIMIGKDLHTVTRIHLSDGTS